MDALRGGHRGISVPQTFQRAVNLPVIQEQPHKTLTVMVTADGPEAGHSLLHLQGDQLQHVFQVVLILLIASQSFLPGHVRHRVTGK